ncbi:MAG: class I SAM-dependent methyltransferase, partial [Victivallales bacterium]|nr:class I SAM-dependent methyltransferase [Victivallales bacterium]
GSVVCADNSAAMLEEANRKIAERKIRNLSTESLDLEKDAPASGEYDLIFSSLTLHHVADASGLLAQLASMLKDGGWLALADLEEEDGSFHGDSNVPHKGFSSNDVAAQLSKLGFCDITSRTVYGIPREHRNYPVFLIAGCKHLRQHPQPRPMGSAEGHGEFCNWLNVSTYIRTRQSLSRE